MRAAGQGKSNRQAETELLTCKRTEAGIVVVKGARLIFKNPEARGLFD